MQWGSYLCLYAATSVEWNPADGMRGFIGRLSKWIERAAAGTLDPDGQPLHPPVVYSKSEAGRLLVHPDLGDRVPWDAGRHRDARLGDAGRLVRGQPASASTSSSGSTCHRGGRVCRGRCRDVFHGGRPVIVIPAVLIADEFGFEYPSDVKALSEGLAESGYDRDAAPRRTWRPRPTSTASCVRGRWQQDPDAAGVAVGRGG